MKILKSVKISLIALFIWSSVAGLFLNEILKGDGLYAQIAIPIIFGIIHLVITVIAITQIYFIHKLTIKWKLKVLYGILLAIPFGLALWKVPLFNTLL